MKREYLFAKLRAENTCNETKKELNLKIIGGK